MHTHVPLLLPRPCVQPVGGCGGCGAARLHLEPRGVRHLRHDTANRTTTGREPNHTQEHISILAKAEVHSAISPWARSYCPHASPSNQHPFQGPAPPHRPGQRPPVAGCVGAQHAHVVAVDQRQRQRVNQRHAVLGGACEGGGVGVYALQYSIHTAQAAAEAAVATAR